MPSTFEESEKDNIVILAPNGKDIYSIPPSVYTAEKYRFRPEQHAKSIPIWSELENGVVVAKLHGFGTGVGGFCYLLNLPALKPQENIHPPQAIKTIVKSTQSAQFAFFKELADKTVSVPKVIATIKAAPRAKKSQKAKPGKVP